MSRVAIVVTSQFGQTLLIANRLLSQLKARGHEGRAICFKTEMDYPEIALDLYDAVLIGTPVYWGKAAWQIYDWTKLYARVLATLPTGLFVVGFRAGDLRPSAKEQATLLCQKFNESTNLKPDLVEVFAGAI